MVMQSADERMGADAADPLNWARDRRIFAQRSVRSGLIIVGGVFAQDPAQVHFAQDDKASRAAEFHHRALTEPYVSLSTHTAPSIQPFAYVERLCLSYAAPPITGWPPAQGRIPLPLRSSPITGLSAL